MTPEEAIRACVVHGQTDAIRSLISIGYDTDGIGAAFVAAQSRRADAKTETQLGDDPPLQKIVKGMTSMNREIRKTLIDAGPIATIRKSIYNDALKALGEELRQPGDSDAKAYTRGLETDEGIALHDLYKRAPADPPLDYVEHTKPAAKGPANVELATLAANHRQANRHLSAEQAYVAVLLDPDNRELATRVKAEDLSAMPRTPRGMQVRVDMSNPDKLDHARMSRTAGP